VLGAPSANIFLGYSGSMGSGWPGAEKSRRAAGQAAKILRIRPFWRPGPRIPGDRATQLGETEVPNAAGQRREGGLHDQRATATTGGIATTLDDVDRIRVPTITVTAPQHAQSIAGRALRGGVKRLGSNFSMRCSKPIRRLQLACRKPKLNR